MDKINEVFEEYYSDINKADKQYFKTHGRYFRTDTVIAFGGFKEALQYKDPEIKKLRDALEKIRDRIPRGQIGLPYKIAYEALKEIPCNT